MAPTNPPEPTFEEDDPNIFWKEDPCDHLMPTFKGFVSDCVYYSRGREVPTLFTIWSSLFAISSVVKREAWLKWADSKLYPNIYAMIVAPAGAAKKNSAIDLACNLLDFIDEVIPDDNIKGMKMINPFSSRATPESLVKAMVPESKRAKPFVITDNNGLPILDDHGDTLKYYPASEIAIAQHELGTLLGRQSYMEGLIDLLLNLYDCHNRWSNNTIGRGAEELLNIHVNFIAATTPTALKQSLPTATVGDGFLSRTLIVYQGFTEREFDDPRVPEAAPSVDSLRKRLAWIASNTFGEWAWSEEAKAYKKLMYHNFKTQLGLDGGFQGMKSRLDIIIYKTALLLRWQRYERNDRIISLQDLLDAEYLVMQTFAESRSVYKLILSQNMNDAALKVEELVKRSKRIERHEIVKITHASDHIISETINTLYSEGAITVHRKGRLIGEPTNLDDEAYVWKGFEDQKKKKKRIGELGLTPEEVRRINNATADELWN